MTIDELVAVYERLSELTQAGSTAEAQQLLIDHMSRLPESLQKQIITRAYFDSLVEEASEIETIDRIQELGLQAIEAIEKYISEGEKEPEA